MTDFKILTMHANHIDDVVAIETQTSATPWSATTFINEINSPTHILLVAAIDSTNHAHTDKVIGFTGGQLVGDELHIHSLAVQDSQRRNGVGENLILRLIEISKERDAASATLEVRVSNEPAKKLYAKLGFKEEGIRPKYYADNGEDASIMWLRKFG